jgi:hypothetical protein
LAEALAIAGEAKARPVSLKKVTLAVRLALECNIALLSSLEFIEKGRSKQTGFKIPISTDMTKRI